METVGQTQVCGPELDSGLLSWGAGLPPLESCRGKCEAAGSGACQARTVPEDTPGPLVASGGLRWPLVASGPATRAYCAYFL